MDGVSILVPAATIRWRSEKYSDILGDRSSAETYRHKDDYAYLAVVGGYSHWLYLNLVRRNAFVKHDSIMFAAAGDKLPIKPECTDWFLFPSD